MIFKQFSDRTMNILFYFFMPGRAFIKKRRMKLRIHSQNSTVNFGNGQAMSSHTSSSMWLLIHAGIKVKPC